MSYQTKIGIQVFSAAVLAGCMVVPRPSLDELNALNNPPPHVQEKVNRFFPRALAWFKQAEVDLQMRGRILTESEKAQARKLGVRHPDAVRVVVLETFPMPADPDLRTESERYGLGSRHEGGRTMGSVILLKPWAADNPSVLVHELVHISQFERLGREAYLRRYIIEMEMMGYARSPLELEAFARQREAH